MCGRFTLTATDQQRLGERFGVGAFPAEAVGRSNVAPTEPIAVVAGDGGHLVRWGLRPPWAEGARPARPPMINARSETVLQRSAFSRLIRDPHHRCLVIADGFYEWLRPEDRKAGRPVPFRFSLPGDEPFAMAGLWGWKSATILTCAPNTLVGRLHDRMPVILPGQEAERAWLSSDVAVEDLLALCCALPAERMVSSAADPDAVNKVGPVPA